MNRRRLRRAFGEASADQRRAADEAAAQARADLAAGGFAANVSPDPALEAQARAVSFDAVMRLRQAEAEGKATSARSAALSSAAPRSVLRRPVLLTGLVAATVVVAVVVSAVLPGGTPSAAAGTPPLLTFSQVSVSTDLDDVEPARAELLTLASRAAAQPAVDGSRGYVLTRSEWALSSSADASDPRAAVVPFETTITVTPDGAAVRVDHRGTPLTPDGRGIAGSSAPPGGPALQTDRFPPGYLDLQLPASLPRDPTALRGDLVQRGDCLAASAQGAAASGGDDGEDAVCLVKAVTSLYSYQLLPPDLQAALWQVLAAEPGLKLAGTGTDRAGRPCVAVVLDTSQGGRTERWVLMADPATGAFLGMDQMLTAGSEGGVPAPVVLDFTVERGARSF
ncbi:hypothetical protein SAMN06264364_1099 [Quadrisphaera granulorum]|uniref:CU044_5270 family protein n=1 Tax=Quadrisphaera granulorum TaxID=317664 RepID=A0A316AA99_9ACTN|nr:CU044_5270 family protein [Quadrisphaera granulorum]PWJ53930.1 hypothetical protein BXY45_1099 [Quadrisphaera granulorum]SZE96387.1 hypothetical protein SAMN06264364_1099 [Quadrisphaera granulorum]